MDKTIVSQLRNLGLSDKEASLYLTLLGLNQASVQGIAAAAHLNRSTAYVLLDSLTEKRFVERHSRAGVLEYSAHMPQELLKKAEGSVVDAELAHTAVVKALDELEAIMPDKKDATRAIFFESMEGIKATWQEVIAASATVDVRGFLHASAAADNFKEKKSGVKIIAATNGNGAKLPEHIRLIPAENYSFMSDFYIFGNTIALISEAEEFAVRIESKQFAEVLRETFDLAWEESGRLDAKFRKARVNSQK
ncbi:MAG TPA: helix-turn-helix domain-containing protein [Candidatus Paceibacterota bacterium]|nr:helix-turn-helix domain-containing protein [Candidatus Paceibacterota bacterium]